MDRLRPESIPAHVNATALKIIAIISMAIDHIGFVLFPDNDVLRIIGRISFPIFCFLLVEGAHYTRDIRKYALRLFIFALLSEIPFDLAIYKRPFYFGYQNVIFTMLIGVLMLWCIKSVKSSILMLIGVLACGLSAYFLKTDYGAWGISLILSFYVASVQPLAGLALFVVLVVFKGGLEVWGLFALIPLFFYNGQRGRQKKYFFYAFYPLHLLAIFLVYYCLA